jgi:hypothetical protein
MSNADLINRYTPVIWLHKDEKYFPCSVDWLLEHSKLIDFNRGFDIAPPVTQLDLYNIAKQYNFQRAADGEVVLSFTPDLYKGQVPLSKVPCYALVRETADAIYISYIFVFAYNGEYSILGLGVAGMHPGDIEHITVEVNKATNQLSRVFFSAHGTKDGRWVQAEDVEFMDNKIVAYCALNGHGMYPHNGTVFRLGGVINDYLGQGTLWQPKAQEFFKVDSPSFDPKTMGFFAYNSRIGGPADRPNTEGITGIADKGWIQAIDNPDPSFYSPPRIFSPTVAHVSYIAKRIVGFAIVYYLMYKLLNFVAKYVNKSAGNKSTFTLKQHIVTILLAVVLYMLYKKVGLKILQKYAPS